MLWQWLISYVGPRYPDSVFRPTHFLPEGLRDDGLEEVCWLSGGCMAWRREVLDRYQFNELLAGYAAAEDVEFGYRVSRQWCLALNKRARVYHLQHHVGRPDPTSLFYHLLLNLSFIGRTCMEQSDELRRHILRHHRRFTRARGLMGVLGGRGLADWRAGLRATALSASLLKTSSREAVSVYEAASRDWELRRRVPDAERG
jgi:GT2 family glycosyltransferase